MRKEYFLALLIMLALVFLALSITPSKNQADTSEALAYHSKVCITYPDGRQECSKNEFTYAGRNMTRDYLGNMTTGWGAVKYIALGNRSSPVITSTSLEGEINECGLTRTTGEYAIQTAVSPQGNWTLTAKFTASCPVTKVNTTGLFNVSTAVTGNIFAGNNFTAVDLGTNDQITVTWYLWVS